MQSAGGSVSHPTTEHGGRSNVSCKVRQAGGLENVVGVLEPKDRFGEIYTAGVFCTAVTITDSCIPLIPPTSHSKSIGVAR